VSGAARVVASFACGRYDRTEPIESGEITPDEMDLVPMILHPAGGLERCLGPRMRWSVALDSVWRDGL
jgi:hypothetical protein